MKRVYNIETRRTTDNVYYRDSDWGVDVDDAFSDPNFTTVAPPADAFDGVPYDWDAVNSVWVVDQVAKDHHDGMSTLDTTDISTIRVLEDLVNTLITKGTIVMTDLPQAAQDKLNSRSAARGQL